MWLWYSAVAWAALPDVALTWKGDAGTLAVTPPVGQEIEDDSPATLALAWHARSVELSGTAGEIDRLQLWNVSGATVEGALSVQLCTKSDGVCKQVDMSLSGAVPEARRGRLSLAVAVPEPAREPAHGPAFQTDGARIVADAFAEAARTGQRVLLDFGAVWCPPCNLLSAEVLEADPLPAELDAVVLAAVDVDDPRSYDVKSRYAVGGYPTVIVADADGTEISRVVGYEGREAFLAWLGRASSQGAPDEDPTTLDPSTVEPERAAEIAWTLAQRRHDDLEGWIARAEEGAVTRALRLARVAHEATVEDAQWLAEHAPGDALRWVPTARATLADDDQGVEAMRAAVRRDLGSTVGSEASDLLYFLAELADEADRAPLYAAAAATLRTSFTGDPAHDRAHLTWLASLTAKSGDLDGAIAVLDEATARWPDEPTFHLSATRILLESERFDAALARSEQAMATSWGDNRLRAATGRCKVLDALDRRDEAAALARAILDEVPAPTGAQQVRAHRYRESLEEFLE